ncbi:MAG: hypothetical protein IKS51_08615 [Erysipelotrichaceae bacterium]|nr:hypothetical protein [Erysipelotrichaceae bacterium]
MKRIITILLAVCVSVLFLLHEDHMHILAAPDYGVCPECGQPRSGGYITGDPTCTEGASFECWCNNPACVAYGSAEGGYTPPLGHDYAQSTVSEATCTQNGVIRYTCRRCSDSYDQTTAALGHDYHSSVTKAATCTESGTRTYSCSRCSDAYTETIKALGHEYTYEETEATCTEGGHKIGTCSRCGNVTDEVSPALGHDMGEAVIVKEASCEEDGLKETVCHRCGEKVSEIIPKTGHKYPEKWTIEKEAGLLTKGLKYKVCEYCGERIEEVIPALISPTMLLGGGGILAVAGAILYYVWKRKKKIVEDVTDKKKFKPSIETKAVVIDSADEKFVKLLKGQSHLKVATVNHEESTLSETVEEKEPDLVICDVLTKDALNELIELKKEAFPDTPLALIVNDKAMKGNVRALKKLKEDKTILDYAESGTNPYRMMVRFVLPVLKPELDSDETLDNIGQITDLLGIPGISSVINVYVSGRDIKSTLEEGELGVVEGATIIGDVASIMGWDQVEDIAGLVNDVDAIRNAFKKDGGAYERKKGVKAAKDITDVVSDLTD